MRAADIGTYIESVAPTSTALPGDECGLVFGDPNAEVRGVGVCWWATAPVIGRAAANGLNVLLVHEQLFTHCQGSPWYEERPLWSKPVNLNRMQALLDGGFTVYRYHSNWDACPDVGVADSFGRELGFTDEVARGAFTRTYAIPPASLRDLTRQVAARLPMCPPRAFGDPQQIVRRVGTMIGGFGGNQPNMPEEFLAQGAEAIVMADMVENTALNALESGMSVIETLHSASEEPAMRAMAELVQRQHPDLRVEFLPSGVHTYGSEAL